MQFLSIVGLQTRKLSGMLENLVTSERKQGVGWSLLICHFVGNFSESEWSLLLESLLSKMVTAVSGDLESVVISMRGEFHNIDNNSSSTSVDRGIFPSIDYTHVGH